MRLVFLLGCALLLATVLCISVEEEEEKISALGRPLKREKKSVTLAVVALVFAGIQLVMDVGRTIFEAVQYFKTQREAKWAKVIVYVINYSNWSMTNPETHISENTDILLPRNTIIHPKEIQAWTSTQTGEDAGIEGRVAWNVLADRYCTVYWKIPKAGNNRDPNGIALGCFPTGYSGDVLMQILTAMITGADSGNVVYRVYGRKQTILQYCDPLFCLQGMMEPGHRANVSITVIPRSARNAIPGITQEAIDQSLDERNHCKVDGCEERGSNSGAIRHNESIALIALILVMYSIW